MLMLFSMQRPDILSYSDLAIQRGLRMVYHHRDITRKLFEKYRRRYSPLQQCGQSIPVGGSRWSHRRNERLRQTTKKKRS